MFFIIAHLCLMILDCLTDISCLIVGLGAGFARCYVRTTRIRPERAELGLLAVTPGDTAEAARATNNEKSCFGNN
jgi:hypothetical protein